MAPIAAELQDQLTALIGERPSTTFAILLLFHVAAGLTCVVAGAVAALSRKGPGRHAIFGEIYYWGLTVVFLSSTVMSLLRWFRDYHLFVLGGIALGAASTGHWARKVRWRNWLAYHITGMGTSYIVLLTAFYVDNGPNLPLWNQLPTIAFWTLPSVIGLPFLLGALRRRTSQLCGSQHPKLGKHTERNSPGT